MAKKETWILVADAARARVFRFDREEKRLEPAWHEQLVGSKLASRKIGSDRPGRTFDSGGEGRHAKEPPTDPARYEKERFAREVVDRLEDELNRHAFGALVVVAPPQFLGDLRTNLSPQLAACVTAEINKDLSKLTPSELLEHLKSVV
jgi:protein required for attachment to host cells